MFHNAYADAFGPVFLIAAMIAAVSVLAIAVVRGTPLRNTVAMKPASQPENGPLPQGDAAGAQAEPGAESRKSADSEASH